MKILLILLLFNFSLLDSANLQQDSWTLRKMEKFRGDYINLSAFNLRANKKVLRKLDAKTLIELTNNEDVGIRSYAFMALVELNHNSVKEIFLSHLDDNEELMVGTHWSCIVEYMQVNEFMLDQLHPVGSKSGYRLTRQEYDEYRKLFQKDNK